MRGPLLILTTLVAVNEAYRALVLFPYPFRSHAILGDSIVNSLAKAGNQVTYITAFPNTKTAPGVRKIDVSSSADIFKDKTRDYLDSCLNKTPLDISFSTFVKLPSEMFLDTIQNKEVQRLINDPNEHFDIVIVEWLLNEQYDLKKLLDNSKDGLIFFSLGSNIKSKYLPDQLKQSLLKMFGGLKQTVLWKFEEDLPGTPPNVHIVQWAPQHSILAHPNCIIFLTHGGLLSTTETIHFGKPIIAVPVFADQFTNARRAVQKGFGIHVDMSYNLADDIKAAVQEMTSNPKYSLRAKELSLIYHDRPVTPDKELMHWIDHVVKTGGAAHLKSPALLVPWYQKLYLDLLAVIAILIYAIIYGIKRVISHFKKNKSKTKRKTQ
ncbi:UDP-glycosyltransferase UGT5-like [Zerene cesonia]|uniref:UDP-glycosyltransferase UGT5-like n=1 Tax=Zerene cesonia TaxID=33412 RepID=UPI0018E505BB|nr:UDP-glycosyltransferase UGT5-like [Zerene cesonia]